MSAPRHWHAVCALEDIVPDTGVCALIDGQQVAVFRVGDAVHAIGNHDPASGANVLARGLVGSLDGEPVVASPLYKQHYSLITGRCCEDATLSVPTYLTRQIDGQLWVRSHRNQKSRLAPRRLVVIGNGIAALRTLEELLAHTASSDNITVFGEEPGTGYNRVLLSSLLAGDQRLDQVVTHPASWYAEHGITLHAGDPVVSIDRIRRCVQSQQGVEVSYDRLLIATGSRPVRLTIPGAGLPGVVSFRELRDVDAMLAAARLHRRAVVVGGGVLGVEAAHGLQQQGMAVTVVQSNALLMNRQLDSHAAALLRDQLAARGLEFRMPARPTAILGDTTVTGVQLEDGSVLPADLVVTATGVRPEIGLAQSAGLQCRRGILVDDTLQTFDPSIYAVGECVQHRDATYELVAPLQEQARVCAAHLAGRGVVRFAGARAGTQLKVKGIELYAAGDARRAPEHDELVLRDPHHGIYRRLVLEGNRLRGALLYGDTRDGPWYLDLIREARDVSAFRDRLLFGEAHCHTGT